MTCREFMDTAEALTPSQLLRMTTEDASVSAHAGECTACGKWVESQRLLGNALQSLRSITAQRGAGPRVEQVVLQAFRTHGFAPSAVVVPEPAEPALWRLSRAFEIGAYAAVAAALIVGVFLGSRMWRDKQAAATQAHAQTVTAPQSENSSASVAAANSGSTAVAPNETGEKATSSVAPRVAPASSKQMHPSTKSADNAGFVALMLCDPLICSGDEQVIRMELPGSSAMSADGNATQPVIADVVIGEDGLVRAMRIVN
jgi:hypothetical protein